MADETRNNPNEPDGLLDIIARRQEEERRLGEQLVTELEDLNQASQNFEIVRQDADATMMRNLSRHAAASSAFAAQQAKDLDELLEMSNTLTETTNQPLRRSLDPIVELFSPEDSIAGQSAKIRAKQTQIAIGENKQQLADNELQSRTRVLNQEVQSAANLVSGEAQDIEHVQNLLSATAAMRTNEVDATQEFVSLATDSQILEAKRQGDVPAEMVDEELAARSTRRINLGMQRMGFAQQRYRNADDAARKEMVEKGQVSNNFAKRVKNNQIAQELDIESKEAAAEIRRMSAMNEEALLKAVENGEINPFTAQQVLQQRASQRTAAERQELAKRREGREESLSKLERLDTDVIRGMVDDPKELKKHGVTRFEAETALGDRETRSLNRHTARLNQQITQQAAVTNALQRAPDAELDNPQSKISQLTTTRQREDERIRRSNAALALDKRFQEVTAGDAQLKEQLRNLALNNMSLDMARAGMANAATSSGVTTIGGLTFRFDELQQQVERLAGSSVNTALGVSAVDNAKISMDATMASAALTIGLPATDASLEAVTRSIINSPNAAPGMQAAAHQALVALGVADKDQVPLSAKATITQTAEEALRQAAAAQAELKLQNTPKQRRPAAAQYIATRGRILDEDIAYNAIGSQIASGSTSSPMHDAVLGHLRKKMTTGNTSADLSKLSVTNEGIPTGPAVRSLMEDERTGKELRGIAVAFAHQNLWEQTAQAMGDNQLVTMLRTGNRALYDANGALNAADMFTFLRGRDTPNSLENFLAKARELAPQSFRGITIAEGDSAESIASLNKILYSGSPVRWHMEVFDGKVRQDQARSIEAERRATAEPIFSNTVLGP